MKIKSTLSILFLFIIFQNSSGQLTFWNKMFLYYPLNGNTMDYSGFNNHGNAVEINYSTGIFNDENGAAKLNGINSYIYRQFFNLSDSCTLTGWFFSESDSQSTAMIYNGNTGSNGYGIFIKKQFGSLLTGYYGKKIILVQGGVSENTFNASYDFLKNEWIHLALVRRGQIFELYLNGEFLTTGIINANEPTCKFCLGSSPEHFQAGYPSFLGKIDEVILFQAALEPQDVQKVYITNLTDINLKLGFENTIKIFPNPTKFQNISIASTTKLLEISLSNIIGNEIVRINRFKKNNCRISIQNIKKGIYIMTIKTINKTETRKLEIQ